MGDAQIIPMPDRRLTALWRFALAISVLNLLGHTLLGFEQAWAHPLVALVTAYAMELGIEAIDAWAERRPARFLGSARRFVEFLLPAHITGLAVSMLLYAGERYWVIALAAAIAIASKALIRAPVVLRADPSRWSYRHVFNPSNFGIAIVLTTFPDVGISPPYQFTENVRGPLDVLIPLIIVASGSFLNIKLTGRVALIGAWLGAFVAQALVRAWWFDLPPIAGLLPVTGMAFVLFTFYMVTDPGTTPQRTSSQIAFGASVAIVYGVLMSLHIVFGLFFALTIVSLARCALMYLGAITTSVNLARAGFRSPALSPAVAGLSHLAPVGPPLSGPGRRRVGAREIALGIATLILAALAATAAAGRLSRWIADAMTVETEAAQASSAARAEGLAALKSFENRR